MDQCGVTRLSCRRLQQKLVWLKKYISGAVRLPPETLPLSVYVPDSQARALRSDDFRHQHTLILPGKIKDSFTSSFAYSAGSNWNCLSADTCNAILSRFKRKLHLN